MALVGDNYLLAVEPRNVIQDISDRFCCIRTDSLTERGCYVRPKW